MWGVESRGGGGGGGAFIPLQWARCDVNQIDDESLGLMLQAAGNSPPEFRVGSQPWFNPTVMPSPRSSLDQPSILAALIFVPSS